MCGAKGVGGRVPRDMGFFVPVLVLLLRNGWLSWSLPQRQINGR